MRLALITACLLCTSACSVEAASEISKELASAAVDAASSAAADALRASLEDALLDEGLPVEEVAAVAERFDVAADISYADADANGYVDGSLVSFTTAGRSFCIDMSAPAGSVSDGPCGL